ncbi:MAG: c-type cytochrome [Gemmataceae bacterium]
MAATDQFYRSQRILDIVFGVTGVLMLISIVWMFAQDYNREFKKEQRRFRDVESAMFQRLALHNMPDAVAITAAEEKVKAARAALNQDPKKSQLAAAQAEQAKWLPVMVKAEADYQDKKAVYDSIVSLYNIEVDEHGQSARAQQMLQQVQDLESQLNELLIAQENAQAAYDAARAQQQAIEKELTDAVDELNKLNAAFDLAAKNAIDKSWGWGDWFRALPVIDGFASPTRIHQYTLRDLPIDYNFMAVTRFDRCTTCHLGIDRPSYTRENLQALRSVPADMQSKLDEAVKKALTRQGLLQETGGSLGYNPKNLRLNTVELTDRHVNEYCVHPRLDLFVAADSPHPADKFGCTSCHAGQGSATTFLLATHTPNNTEQKRRWEKEEGWVAPHYWDFPMLPNRFIESSCVKCHHQITDLIRDGSRVEAPKLVQGYHLVRENGCFGCHDIAGTKNGVSVGPDLRLEPWPPVDMLPPNVQAKMQADTANPPGTMRKVGPSLRHLSQKTNESWTRQWIHDPRGFRPDTKMPHFFGLSNNSKAYLEQTAPSQANYPAAEVYAMTRFLFQTSDRYLQDEAKARQTPRDQVEQENARRNVLLMKPTLTGEERRELYDLNTQYWMRVTPEMIPAADLPPVPADDAERDAQLVQGRKLFSEKGCLACHIHDGTQQAQGMKGQPDFVPAIASDNHFGPNLSRLAAKLGTSPGDEPSARYWLTNWIMNPNSHNPRTFMPITQVSVDEASAIAAWLLSQKPDWEGQDIPEPSVDDTLIPLARLHLRKMMTQSEVDEVLKQGLTPEQADQLPYDADEQEMRGPIDDANRKDKLLMYIGRKAVSQYGCFGCHDIPGYEMAKPIGTPLNDWGKKDRDRLAFEDIKAYVHDHYHSVPSLIETDSSGKPKYVEVEDPQTGQTTRRPAYVPAQDGKPPYEQYFYEALRHHEREGFLNQKLLNPRSYDYNRQRTYDDRLRMPEFRFARTEPQAGETPEEYETRRWVEEAEAREQVMTFVLGLLADPMPAQFRYDPPPARKAEVLGRHVIDKYNCASCHLLRPGLVDFKVNDDVLEQLDLRYAQFLTEATTEQDFSFTHHNAWVGLPPKNPDRLRAYTVFAGPEEFDPDMFRIPLVEALMYYAQDEHDHSVPRNFRAGYSVFVPTSAVLSHHPELGGGFAANLVNYLIALDDQLYKPGLVVRTDSSEGRAAAPPPLLREGERVQPNWLYQFLRNPTLIRPATKLRMPKFNMSDAEAMALVNYFAAVDKISNPAVTINYPYVNVPQHDETYWRQKTKEYVARLRQKEGELERRIEELQPYWQRIIEQEQLPALQAQLQEVEETLKRVKDDDAIQQETKRRDAVQQQIQALQTQLKDRTFTDLRKQWEEEQAYATDAYRLVLNRGLCLQCHNISTHQTGQRVEQQGPSLNLSAQRLRPDWSEYWIANPPRMLSYLPGMPQNFKAKDTEYQQLFLGDSLQQVEACRDVLMNLPKVADMPVNRLRPPTPAQQQPMGGN